MGLLEAEQILRVDLQVKKYQFGRFLRSSVGWNGGFVGGTIWKRSCRRPGVPLKSLCLAGMIKRFQPSTGNGMGGIRICQEAGATFRQRFNQRSVNVICHFAMTGKSWRVQRSEERRV